MLGQAIKPQEVNRTALGVGWAEVSVGARDTATANKRQNGRVYRLSNGSATVSASLQAESLARESASRESAAARESASLQAQRSSEDHESLQQQDNEQSQAS